MTVSATAMRAGDRVAYRGVAVTILRDGEPHEDRFGQPQVWYWAKREDTNAEGYFPFGTTTTLQLERV
jgi:hypothetical protein